MENVDDLLNKLKERLTLEQELLIKEFHFENGETRKIGDEEGDSYRIIEDKLTGAIFKVKYSNMVIKSKEGLYYTVEEFNDFLDKRFDEIFGTSIAKKKKNTECFWEYIQTKVLKAIWFMIQMRWK